MNFRKTQITRGKPENGFVYHAFDSSGYFMFDVSPVYEENYRGEIVFSCGSAGERFSTLKQAKEEAKRIAGYL